MYELLDKQHILSHLKAIISRSKTDIEMKAAWIVARDELKKYQSSYIAAKRYNEYQEISAELKIFYKNEIRAFSITQSKIHQPAQFSTNRAIIYDTIARIERALTNLGYIYIPTPIIDSRYNCFDFLNMSEHTTISHEESFYLKPDTVLRPHTTNMQAHMHEYIKDYRKTGESTLSFYTLGPVFRRDDSSRHLYVFHQFDTVTIIRNRHQTIELIKDFFLHMIDAILGREYISSMRIRSSYFPFTSPSYEIDILNDDTIYEIFGAGYISPNIKEKLNISTADAAIATGWGIERLAMIVNNIKNIKELIHE